MGLPNFSLKSSARKAHTPEAPLASPRYPSAPASRLSSSRRFDNRKPISVRDSELRFRDARSIPAAFPYLHSIMKRAPALAIPRGAGVLPGGSWFPSPLLRAARVARLLSFPVAPVPRAPVPRRCGSWSGAGLAPPLLVLQATAVRLPAPALRAPRAAPAPRRFHGRAAAAGEADGWPRSAAGRRSRRFLRPQDVWT